MNSNFGHNINYTLFGESHGEAIGITITGLPANFTIDFEVIDYDLLLRQGNASFNTPRQEKTDYKIISGYFNDKTTGQPLTVLFLNEDVKSNDYFPSMSQPRPGHADLTAMKKYDDANDHRGGGHFSGRMTTPIVFMGSIVKQIMQSEFEEMSIVSHIKNFGEVQDKGYYDIRKEVVEQRLSKIEDIKELTFTQLAMLSLDINLKMSAKLKEVVDDKFPTYSQEAHDKMIEVAQGLEADTLGGIIETSVINPPAWIGEPFFCSVESYLSSLLFSIPSVKGVRFGSIEEDGSQFGSDVKDEIIFVNKNKATTLMNNNGGINGGITNGEAIVFNTLIKPIASLLSKQQTFNLETKKVETLEIKGRHDKTIINRIIPVIEAMSYLALYDLYLESKKNK